MPDITITLSDKEYATAETLAADGIGTDGDSEPLTTSELVAWQTKEYLRAKGNSILKKLMDDLTADDIKQFKKWKESQ